MLANVSHLKTHLQCPTLGYYEHTLRRRRYHKLNQALEVGICWHKAMETYLKTGSKEEGRLAATDYLSTLNSRDINFHAIATEWGNLELAFNAWSFPDHWEIVATEYVISVPIPPRSTFNGTLDAVVFWNGGYWHLQHKTLASSKSLPNYWAYMQRDWHECAYQHMCKSLGIFQPYRGTILNVVRKLSRKTLEAKVDTAYSVNYISRSDAMVEKAWRDIVDVVREMEPINDPLIHVQLDRVRQNRTLCAGVYGNSTCPYIDVCNGVVSISDDTEFRTEDSRYDLAGTQAQTD